MIIGSNTIAASVFVPYIQSLNSLQNSSLKLSTGEKYAPLSSGNAELGIANDFRRKIKGINALISGQEDAKGYAQTQDEILSEVADIIQRMNELATSALDTTKTADERAALNTEFAALDQEVEDLAANSTYNGTRLFETTTTVRIGLETTDTVVFSRVRLSLLSFSNLSVTNTTAAQSAVSRLAERLASLNVMRAISQAQGSRVERTISVSREMVSNLGATESAIRNVDLAEETGEFTRKQVISTSAQTVLASVQRLPSSASVFLSNLQ
ncbi:MAG: hypothetical protein CMO81_08605 [Waddliaceae bacterium]|nr:hypothetical protein [Waddliaceae bacterium]